MHFTTSFFTLLVAATATLTLAAPVPNPSNPSPPATTTQKNNTLSVDALIKQAKGDPMVIVQQFKPVADQIVATLAEMVSTEETHKESTGAHHSPDKAHEAHHDANAPAAATPDTTTSTTGTAEKHEAAAADPNAAPTDSPAAAAADAGAAAGGVQKRTVEDPTQAAAPAPTDATTPSPAHAEAHPHADAAHAEAHPHTHPEAHSKDHKEHKEHKEHKDKAHKDKKHDKHKAKAAKAPVGRKIHTDNVKKLRDLMAKANMMQEAIETIVLNNDQSIEKMPSDKNPKGVAWGLANAPVLAFSNMFNFSKQL